MSALRKVLVVHEEPVVGTSAHRVQPSAKASVVIAMTPRVSPPVYEAPASTRPSAAKLLRNMALFLSAPFIGLLYAVLLPFVGLGLLVWIAAKPLLERPRVRAALQTGKAAARLMAAPFVGLAYVVFFPFIAMAMLVWVAASPRRHAAAA
ncbi:hypothetical protein BURC_02774 [Burkholderiaceae bacterium]|nr:hypothetical protein BURC_02774 [Burkholderiaceae bacterium]